jgi:Zn finger protein HypA/HybF involved in hydrogenase expression
MHEITFAKNIIEQIPDKDKVQEIELEVGELAEVTAPELKETIEKMTGWNVKTKEMESRVKCECGFIGRAKIKERGHHIIIYVCPKCGINPRVIAGQEIKLKRVVYN